MTAGLDGRVAVVTGGGRGLGRAYALALAASGASVVVNDLGATSGGEGADAGPAHGVVEEILGLGGDAIASTDSVATSEGGAAIVDRAVETWGRVDVVINNAGVLRDRTVLRLSDEDIRIVLEVNLLGAFHVSRAAMVHMRAAAYGRLVHVTSSAGLFGNHGQANYAAAKMGVVGLSSTVAIEGARHGIRSNVVAPLASTRLTEQVLGELSERLDPAYVVPLVCHLASERCEVSGEIYSAAGGHYARVVVGECAGWTSPGLRVPTPEDVAAAMPTIRDTADLLVPDGAFGELSMISSRLEAGLRQR